MLNAAIDMLSAYGSTLSAAQKLGQLPCAYQLRFMPALILALLKYVSRNVRSRLIVRRVSRNVECMTLKQRPLVKTLFCDDEGRSTGFVIVELQNETFLRMRGSFTKNLSQ